MPRAELRLVRPLIYRGKEDRFLVPEGFVTDLASVPRLFWSVVPPNCPLVAKASVLHDYLYHVQTVSRSDADGIFRRVLREEGAPLWRRSAMWAGVRIGGWWKWSRRARLAELERKL